MTKRVIPLFILVVALCRCGGMPSIPEAKAVPEEPQIAAKIDEPFKRSVAPPEQPQAPASVVEEKKVEIPELKKKILVAPFINHTYYGGDELGNQIALDVIDGIDGTDDTEVLSIEDLDGLETYLNPQGEYDFHNLFDRARSQGVSGLVVGSVEELSIDETGDEVGLFRSRYHTVRIAIRFQLFDTASEKAIHSKLHTAEVTEEYVKLFTERSLASLRTEQARPAIKKAFEPVYKRFPVWVHQIAWVGRIAKIDMQRYYLNAGEWSGLRRGQILKVYGKGDPVSDRASGLFLGVAPGYFKGTLRVVEYLGKDGAVAVLHSGGGFREEDRVEVYSAQR